MAKGEMGDFLNAYFRRLHADTMDYEVLARLVESKKKGFLTPEQQEWFDKEIFIADNSDTNPYKELGYRANDLPKLDNSDGELTEPELRKLYEAFARTMAGMKTASALYGSKDSDAKNFVKRFVDEIGLFPTPKATQECEDSIQKLLDMLDGKPLDPADSTSALPPATIASLKQRIVQTAQTYDKEGNPKKAFDNVAALDDFITKKIRSKKYNSDVNVQKKIKGIATGLYNNWQSSFKEDDVTEAISLIRNSLETIGQDAAFNEINVSVDNLEKFKNGYAEELLNTLYKNKDIRQKFAEQDNDGIVEKIEKAEKKLSYNDPNSTEYIKPKTEDVLTPFQQVQKWATNTYNNSMRKYARLRGDPLLFSAFSKEIFKAIDKEEIKPTDGITGLLDKAGKIKERLPNKTVEAHFDWFVETMNKIKVEKPKALAGAWNNAAQMQCVIGEIMLKATRPGADDGDMEKAKTAMEIMTAMKYGMMTSKVMDALKQTEFTIFSDGKLSWNNNQGIQFVTKAFDQSIKAAFLGIGYGITFVRNKIMMHNMKFTNKNNEKGPLHARMMEERTRLATKRAADQQATNDANTKTRQDISEQTAEANYLRTQINHQAAREANYQNLINNRQVTKNATQTNHDKYNNAKTKTDNDEILRNEFRKLQSDRRKLRTELKDLETQMAPYVGATGAAETAAANAIQTEITPKKKDYEEIEKRMNEIVAQLRDPAYKTDINNARNDVINFKSDYDAYEQASTEQDRFQAKLDELQNDPVTAKTERLNEAINKVNELNDTIDTRNRDMLNWPENNVNKIKELEDFWNFLQTGKTKTWRLFTDKAQEKFDTHKEIWLQNYVSQYGLAA